MRQLKNNAARLMRHALSGSWKGVFAVVFLFVTLSSALFWLDIFRSYETEINVLAVEKRPGISLVTNNLAELAGTLAFYERFAARDERGLLREDLSSLTPDERKKAWQDTVRVEADEANDTLTIRVQDASLEDSRALAVQTAETLFNTASFYYNVRSDIDLRIIDGPLSRRVIDQPVGYVLTSLASGILVTVLFVTALRILPFLFAQLNALLHATRTTRKGAAPAPVERNNVTYRIGDSVPLIDPKKFVPSRPQKLSFEAKTSPDVGSNPAGRASAPDNLPIIEVTDTFTFGGESLAPDNLPFAPLEAEEEVDGAVGTGPLPPQTAEPTPEEYKRRLNKLLSEG